MADIIFKIQGRSTIDAICTWDLQFKKSPVCSASFEGNYEILRLLNKIAYLTYIQIVQLLYPNKSVMVGSVESSVHLTFRQ